MATRTKSKPQSKAARRPLLEFVAALPSGTSSPLRIDEDAGVIFRAKVLGRYSRNSHNLAEAENGTEYTPACMRDALPLYEGSKVKANHPADRSRPAAERDVNDTFGVLRNARVEPDEMGNPAVWADIHYLSSHPLAPRVVEDVRKGLGVYGLSHNAQAGRERFDPATKRLVIESLHNVRSVDLVDKPATNRNLWESEHMPTTLRTLLEARVAKLLKAPRKLARVKSLLEDDTMAAPMDAPMEPDPSAAPEDSTDDALWSGFAAALSSIADQYKAGDLDAKAAGKKMMAYLKAHEGLMGDDSDDESDDSDDVEEDEEDPDCDDDDKGKKKKGDAMESEELKSLRAEKKARELCESMAFLPSAVQLEAVAAVPESRRKALVESFKGSAASRFKTPKSGIPAAAGKKPNRDVTESEFDATADMETLRNG